MNFYNALQADPIVIKQQIRKAETKKEKRRLWFILILRDLLLVGFAILFVTTLTSLFGSKNTGLAVVLFCMLLSLRFVNFGYKITHTIMGLAVVLLIFGLLPWMVSLHSFILQFLFHFVALLLIFTITSSQPEMGNPGLYAFGYIFLLGTMQPLNTDETVARIFLLITAFIKLSWLAFVKHREKHQTISWFQELRREGIRSRRNLWFVFYAFGISLLFIVGKLFAFSRFMWIGFAFSSLLSSYSGDIKERFVDRLSGVVVGSLLFGLLASFLPVDLLAIVGGLALGLCTTYRFKTIFNCFGALATASAVLGIPESVSLRMINNFIGLSLSIGYFFFVKWVLKKLSLKRNNTNEA